MYEIFIDGKPRKIEITKNGETSFTAKVDGKPTNIQLSSEKLDVTKIFSLTIDDKTYKVELSKIDREKTFPVKVDDVTFKAEIRTPKKSSLPLFEPALLLPTKKPSVTKHTIEGAVVAPMTGKILSIKVKKGDEVKAGRVLCVLEAMKMENEIVASKAGVVKEIYVSEGSSVSEGEPLFMVN